MKDILTYNSLGTFSLVILFIVFYQASNYLENDNTKLKKIWLSTIAAAFTVQLTDIVCRYFSAVSVDASSLFLYICNLILFNLVIVMSCSFALFIDYSAEFSDRVYGVMRKAFTMFILINILASAASIPYVILYKPIFRDEILYIISAIICYLPLFYVLLRITIRIRKSLETIVLTGIILPLVFVILQITNITEEQYLYPSITTFLLIMNSLLTINTMYTDHLTGLKNTRGIDKYFSNLSHSFGDYLAVIFLDIDGFKLINDKYGHNEGDVVLRALARILLKNIKSDDLAGRVGGDEFLVAAKLDSPEGADAITEGIERDIERFNNTIQKPYKFSVSYGTIINFPFKQVNKDKLIEEADRKMYTQKAGKKQSMSDGTPLK